MKGFGIRLNGVWKRSKNLSGAIPNIISNQSILGIISYDMQILQ